MRFRHHQDQARAATRRLLLLFLLTVVLTVAAFNGVLALLWMLQTGNLLGFPRWFFETNTVLSAGFILGGSWLESVQLRKGGAHVAEMVGGREVLTGADERERRLRNIVEEMAIASGLCPPRVFVLPRADSINAFAAGWEQHDSVIAVTRGALERLSRDELQGVVAHEFSHILHGDARLNMRLIGHVWGLQLLYMLGRDMMDSSDREARRPLLVILGLGVAAVGSIGWLAGRLLKAAVSRQREFLADAAAVQYTRLPSGIGGALRKIAGQTGDSGQTRLHGVRAEAISHMLLSSDIFIHGGALATHPPLAERVRRIYGRPMAALPSEVLPSSQDPVDAAAADDLGMIAFTTADDAGVPAPVPMDVAPPSTPPAFAAVSPATATAPRDIPAAPWPEALLDIAWPHDLIPAALVYLTGPGEGETRQAWRGLFTEINLPGQDRLLQQVWSQPLALHQGAFERLLTRCAALSLDTRRGMRQQARRIVRADGRLSLTELWRCLLLDHVLDLHHESVLRETHHLTLAQCAQAIDTVGLALASQLLPPGQDGSPVGWCTAVRRALELGTQTPDPGKLSSAGVQAAVMRLMRLGAMSRPRLMKTWCAQALDGAADVPQSALDALRGLCLLIDTPIPPILAARFPDLARLRG